MKSRNRMFVGVCVVCAFLLGATSLAFAKNILWGGQSLRPGEKLKSQNGRYSLILQRDGNLVLYDRGKAIWSSGTQGKRVDRLLMQHDGNLVLYGPRGPLWASNTSGNPNILLRLQNDGNLVLYKAIWSTGTAR